MFPQPLISETRLGKSKLKAELTILIPTSYQIMLEGIQSSEKLRLESFSSGEKIDAEFFYTNVDCISHMPGVIGKDGGFCDLSITRQKGDKLELKKAAMGKRTFRAFGW